MNRVTDSPILKTDFESEISQQLDKIAETGNKFREQILELGEKLKSIQEAGGQKNEKAQDQSSGTSEDWMKSVEIKMQKVTTVQHNVSANIQNLEKRRFDLQELLAGKIEDVLKDVGTLKCLNKVTMDLKPKLEEGLKTIQDLESQVDKMTRDLKGKLELLDSAVESHQNVIESSLEKFGFPTLMEWVDAEGWIVIQKRDSGPRDDFERSWTEYENGFGYIFRNFWIGLKKIHELTADGSMELRIELTDWEGNSGYANYSTFSVSNAVELYRLTVGGYSGNAGDCLQYSNGSQFSTMDKKTGQYEGKLRGGWWKQSCHENMNGLYYEKEEAKLKAVNDFSGVHWYMWKNDYPLQKVIMKIRQRK